MVATSGARLLAEDALDAMRERLIPLASVITPNIPEAELLLGRSITGGSEAEEALRGLLSMGARSVMLKGGHLSDEGEGRVVDRFGDRSQVVSFVHARLELNGHGTGCTLASAITAQLCLGRTLGESCERATDYVFGALRHAYRPGTSNISVLNHFWNCATKEGLG
jgi:hydroxymethylpyrimidine/phosphomethylpyrimidine kinase